MKSELQGWRCLGTCLRELNLDLTLPAGQSFRWIHTSPREWTGVLGSSLISLRHGSQDIEYFVHKSSADPSVLHNDLRNYFRLEVHLDDLIKGWSAERNFKKCAENLYGLRTLRIDPVEATISFICSSNNNVSRITSMVERLCARYGTYVASLEGKKFYTFPRVETLAQNAIEEDLRKLKFGYRAKYIAQSSRRILQNGESWFLDLKKAPYEVARKGIMSLPGVGMKVADCILLLSLEKNTAFPIDTHIMNVFKRDYSTEHNYRKSLTERSYLAISREFQKIFGPYSGWAQSILFARELYSTKASIDITNAHSKARKKKSEIISRSIMQKPISE